MQLWRWLSARLVAGSTLRISSLFEAFENMGGFPPRSERIWELLAAFLLSYKALDRVESEDGLHLQHAFCKNRPLLGKGGLQSVPDV
jgi:hypothetical protein